MSEQDESESCDMLEDVLVPGPAPHDGLALRLVGRALLLAAGATQRHVALGARVAVTREVAARADTCSIRVTRVVRTQHCHVLIKQEITWGQGELEGGRNWF